jgi:hypothetical protein
MAKSKKASNRDRSAEDDSAASGAFAKHAQEDGALADPTDATTDSVNTTGLSMSGRFVVFVIFPVVVGTLGLYLGYLESLRKPERQISFDQDFVVPFLLALAMAAVLFFQTGGFTTKKVKPLIEWPKVRRVKKIVKKKKSEIAEDKVDYQSASNKKED